MRSNLLRVGLVTAAVLGLSAGTGPAFATPAGPGVTGTTVSRTTIDGKDYVLRTLTVPPGQSTGWHFHDGTVYGYVQQGTLSHFDATCQSNGVYPTGTTITEPPDEVHIGRNLGTTPLVLDVLYVLPQGAPPSEDAPNPGCDFE